MGRRPNGTKPPTGRSLQRGAASNGAQPPNGAKPPTGRSPQTGLSPQPQTGAAQTGPNGPQGAPGVIKRFEWHIFQVKVVGYRSHLSDTLTFETSEHLQYISAELILLYFCLDFCKI